ncbi:MAG: DNA-processing protein DprA [bacterium]
MKQNRQTLLHLSLISGIGPATVCKLIAYLLHVNDLLRDRSGSSQSQTCDIFRDKIEYLDTLSFEQIYTFSVADFRNKIGLSEKIATILHQGLTDKKLLEEELELIEKYTIRIDTILDQEYPALLRNINQPPLLLYSKGGSLGAVTAGTSAHPEALTLPVHRSLGVGVSLSKGVEGDPGSKPYTPKRIAFVGARKADKYAAQVIDHLVPGLVNNGWEIVSGGALGVDSMAHKATHDAGGKTIIVLGSGLLKPYPEQNKKFFKKIVASGGTLVSSFPLRMPPDKTTFPARNRIIAGLSQGCVIVQAAQKSGALITAEFALEQGKQVFAVPGSIFNDLSDGCHKLLDHGAKLVKDVSDILGEFGEYDCTAGAASVSGTALAAHQDYGSQESIISQKNNEPVKVYNQVRVSVSAPAQVSNSCHPRLDLGSKPYSDPFLAHFDSMHTLDELTIKSGLSFAELQDKLFCLQLDGLVKQNFAGSWEKI